MANGIHNSWDQEPIHMIPHIATLEGTILGTHEWCTRVNQYYLIPSTKVLLGRKKKTKNQDYDYVQWGCLLRLCFGCVCVCMLTTVETYKFHERVQLDSICSNELGMWTWMVHLVSLSNQLKHSFPEELMFAGDPDALVSVPGRKDLNDLSGWSQSSHLQLLNLT